MKRIKILTLLALLLPFGAVATAAGSGREAVKWSHVAQPESKTLQSAFSAAQIWDHSSVIPTPTGFVVAGNAVTGKLSFAMVSDAVNTPLVSWPAPQNIKSDVFGVAYDNAVYASGLPMSGNSSVIYRIDPISLAEGWKQVAEIPGAPRGGAAIAVQSNGANQSLYIIGGEGLAGDTATWYTTGYAYDLTRNVWTKLNCNFPKGVTSAVAAGANQLLLLANNEQGETVMYRYHTVTNALTEPETVSSLPGETLGFVRVDNENLAIVKVAPDAKPVYVKGELIKGDSSMGVLNWIVIAAYFCLLAFIGFYFARRQKNTNDYFKGGGRIPWWAAGLSLFGTALSAITFMAIPAKAFATDWSYALFNTGIVFVAPVIVLLFIPYFRGLNITTAYQYLEIRFSALIRVICSLAFIIFQVGRMGVVLFLPSIALNVVTGMDIFLCIGIMGVCSIIYTMFGGIEAVVWTDAIQVIILLGGALLSIVFISLEIPGGFTQAISTAAADGKFSLGSTGFDLTDATVWTVLLASFFTNITTYGTDQSMVQRYLTTSTETAAKKSVWTNALLTIPATIIFFLIGTLLYVYYKVHPEGVSITVNSGDAIFPWYIFTQLPAGLTGLLISGIFAAAMSTLSGSMNSVATAYIVDIYPRITNKGAGSLKSAKIATCVAGLISLSFAFLMATWNISSLWDEFNKILGLILGAMGGLFVLGMVTKRANTGGAIIGIVVSMVVQFFVARFHTFHLLLYTASGFITCFAVGYLASWFFPAPAPQKERK